MTLRSRSTLKGFFETGDVPTEQQFADLIDSMLNQQDDLAAADSKLGIGTSSPAEKLEVIGNIRFGTTLNTDNHSAWALNINSWKDANIMYDGGSGESASANFGFHGSGNKTVNLHVDGNSIISGNVGIGTTSPKIKLAIGDDDTGIHQAGDGKLTFYTNNNECIRIDESGKVGIGTSAPIAPLHVATQTSSIQLSGYYMDTGTTGLLPNGSWPISIYAKNSIVSQERLIASGTVITSDARAKHVLGQSDTSTDLTLLRQLKITDYHWIDSRINGDQPQKKLIAQEVEHLYPQAISVSPMPVAIPNVYQKASAVSYDAAEKMLTICTESAHDFAPGEKIDLYTDQGNLEKIEVKHVPSAHEFVVACEYAPEQVFVYGKYVNDFRTIDYDAIAMLNVSATQELAKQVETLQTKLSAIEKENSLLRAEYKSLAGQIAALPTAN